MLITKHKALNADMEPLRKLIKQVVKLEAKIDKSAANFVLLLGYQFMQRLFSHSFHTLFPVCGDVNSNVILLFFFVVLSCITRAAHIF